MNDAASIRSAQRALAHIHASNIKTFQAMQEHLAEEADAQGNPGLDPYGAEFDPQAEAYVRDLTLDMTPVAWAWWSQVLRIESETPGLLWMLTGSTEEGPEGKVRRMVNIREIANPGRASTFRYATGRGNLVEVSEREIAEWALASLWSVEALPRVARGLD